MIRRAINFCIVGLGVFFLFYLFFWNLIYGVIFGAFTATLLIVYTVPGLEETPLGLIFILGATGVSLVAAMALFRLQYLFIREWIRQFDE